MTAEMTEWGFGLFAVIALLQLAAFVVLVWLGVRYFDRRYKQRQDHSRLLSGEFIKTGEIFKDPKDGHRYRVYYNPKTGEREYVKED